ncbi:MAG: CIA30 family protein, partial [Cyanobacteria bacterium J06555_13]
LMVMFKLPMKLALKILGLLGMIAAFWWFNSLAGEPSAANKAVDSGNNNEPLMAPQEALKNSALQNTARQKQQDQQNQEEGRVLTNFDNDAEGDRWRSVNDTVMGGISQSRFVVTPAGTGIFQGVTSLENNGGFSSVRRTSEDVDFTGTDAIAIRVKGDGRRYQLRLRTDEATGSIAYRAEFDTPVDEWLTVRFALVDFEPVFRGRVLEDVGAIAPRNIQQIGFLIADKQSGEFTLETDWIRLE